MAGGKGSRMGRPTEKPMTPFLDKPLIDWVINAVLTSQKISEFYVITSANTPKTEQHCQNKNWKIVHTDAQGYHEDLKQAIKKLDWKGPVLTMPSDVPAITAKILDKIIVDFEGCGKDFLAVFVPIENRQKLGLSISSTDEYQGNWYTVSGINIINGTKILDEGKTETAAIITQETEVTLNINTTKDLEIAKQLINKAKNDVR
jgi:uncharacterized protein (TIGR00454 family)